MTRFVLICALLAAVNALSMSNRMGIHMDSVPPTDSGAACTRLGEQKEASTAQQFGKRPTASQQWYECKEPTEDPSVTCFLAPEWMGLPDGKWLCSDALKSEDKLTGTYPEDSY
jgi:hypothetical protein